MSARYQSAHHANRDGGVGERDRRGAVTIPIGSRKTGPSCRPAGHSASRRGRRRQQRQRLCLQSRRASDDRVRPRRQLPALVGRGRVPRARTACTWRPTTRSSCTDDGDHTVRQCTLDGKVLLTIGIPGKPAPFMSGEPFHRCTHTALSPQGDIYVSDGYGNARVHKYAPDGKLLLSWGEPGTDPGEFNLAAQHLLRCRRLGLCGRPREPSRAGVRRQRQVRDAVEQPAPAVRAVHAAGQVPDLLHRRDRAVLGVQPRRAEPRAARQHLSTTRASCSRGSATACSPARGPASSSRRTGSRSIRAATSMSAKSP